MLFSEWIGFFLRNSDMCFLAWYVERKLWETRYASEIEGLLIEQLGAIVLYFFLQLRALIQVNEATVFV